VRELDVGGIVDRRVPLEAIEIVDHDGNVEIGVGRGRSSRPRSEQPDVPQPIAETAAQAASVVVQCTAMSAGHRRLHDAEGYHAHRFAVPSLPMLRFGIDLGGTKIEILGLDDRGAVVLRRRRPTPAARYEDIVEAIAELVHTAERELATTGSVGVGTPGSRSPFTRLMRNSNTVVLNGRALQSDLEAALQREIRLGNDADCFALSEAVDGAAASARVVFGVILGTGVGGGIVVERRVHAGGNGIAGEWGHCPLPWPTDDERPGPPCYCGRTGCIETFLSGPGLVADHERRAGQKLDARDIVAAAAAGDAQAEATLRTYEDRLARGLAMVVDILDPDAIVLGGGMSNIDRLYDNVTLRPHVFSDDVRTPILRPRHGDSGGVRGAAWLW
jgi:fructokinase